MNTKFEETVNFYMEWINRLLRDSDGKWCGDLILPMRELREHCKLNPYGEHPQELYEKLVADVPSSNRTAPNDPNWRLRK